MKVLIFPKDKNPYQELLYSRMHAQYPEVRVKYFWRLPYFGALFFPLTAAVRRVQGYRLVHVHWPAFAVHKPLPFRRQASYILFKFSMAWLKLLGYKIVWTVHNILPHEPQTTDDLSLMKQFSRVVDAKIVHSETTLDDMKKTDLSTANSTVIPIGSYANLYPDTFTKQSARQSLGIKQDELTILFFGAIRRYKGVTDLIEAFKDAQLPKGRLIIAGNCADERLRQKIERSARIPGIDIYNAFIPDDEVAKYFQACDIVCLPFRKITTSSSVLLAASFAKPVIAPRLGNLLDLPENVGYFYDSQKLGALRESLKKAARNRAALQKLGANGKKYSDSLSWDKIGEQTYMLYQRVLNEPVSDKS